MRNKICHRHTMTTDHDGAVLLLNLIQQTREAGLRLINALSCFHAATVLNLVRLVNLNRTHGRANTSKCYRKSRQRAVSLGCLARENTDGIPVKPLNDRYQPGFERMFVPPSVYPRMRRTKHSLIACGFCEKCPFFSNRWRFLAAFDHFVSSAASLAAFFRNASIVFGISAGDSIKVSGMAMLFTLSIIFSMISGDFACAE